MIATASAHEGTAFGIDDPVWVARVEFTALVAHLGFYPDTEADVVALSVGQQALDTTGQLTAVGHPVAQARRIGTLILAAKPPIVHHEELTAKGLEVGHHLVHLLFLDIHVHAFPTIQQYVAQLVAMAEPILTAPLVESTANTATTLLTVSKG